MMTLTPFSMDPLQPIGISISLIMKVIRLIAILSCSLFLTGCIGTIEKTIDTPKIDDSAHDGLGVHVSHFVGDTISFLGEALILNDSAGVMRQITEIAAKDKMLSVDGRVLTVGEVGFGINVHGNGVILISSVPIDDPQIKPVVQYLKSLYGNPTDADPEVGYYWFDKDIRVRRLHSEEGGTTIIFNGVIKNDEETPAG